MADASTGLDLDAIRERSREGSAFWEDPIEDARALLAEVERLRDGIRRHREAATWRDDETGGVWRDARAHDERLWALLDDRTETT